MQGLWKANVTNLGGMLPRRWSLSTGYPGDGMSSWRRLRTRTDSMRQNSSA